MVCVALAAQPSIKTEPPKTAECQLPLPAHLYQPFLGALPGKGPCPLLHWPSEQVPTRLADGGRVACDTLYAMKKETCLVSASGKAHSNFPSWPTCHFKVISNFYALEGEGELNSRTIWPLLETQNSLLLTQVERIRYTQAQGLLELSERLL